MIAFLTRVLRSVGHKAQGLGCGLFLIWGLNPMPNVI